MIDNTLILNSIEVLNTSENGYKLGILQNTNNINGDNYVIVKDGFIKYTSKNYKLIKRRFNTL